MTTDLDHLYALAEGALELAFHWHTKTALEYDHVLEPEDAAYIAALSPDVVKGLIERVRAAEKALALLPPADGWRCVICERSPEDCCGEPDACRMPTP